MFSYHISVLWYQNTSLKIQQNIIPRIRSELSLRQRTLHSQIRGMTFFSTLIHVTRHTHTQMDHRSSSSSRMKKKRQQLIDASRAAEQWVWPTPRWSSFSFQFHKPRALCSLSSLPRDLQYHEAGGKCSIYIYTAAAAAYRSVKIKDLRLHPRTWVFAISTPPQLCYGLTYIDFSLSRWRSPFFFVAPRALLVHIFHPEWLCIGEIYPKQFGRDGLYAVIWYLYIQRLRASLVSRRVDFRARIALLSFVNFELAESGRIFANIKASFGFRNKPSRGEFRARVL